MREAVSLKDSFSVKTFKPMKKTLIYKAILFNLTIDPDFKLAALFLCITPLFAVLSISDTTSGILVFNSDASLMFLAFLSALRIVLAQ
jgi:hypothetical protein